MSIISSCSQKMLFKFNSLSKTASCILTRFRNERMCMLPRLLSTMENNETDDADFVKRKILDRSLFHVDKLGWSQKSIVEGANECGYSSAAHGLFPRGGADLALHFYEISNTALIDKLRTDLTVLANDDKRGCPKSTGKFIRDAMENRIRMTSVHRESWPEAMALLAHPNAAGEALHLLCQLVDDIWHLAGDESHDMNWYTKRGSLALIYKTTELFMLQDRSEDLKQTWSFLDRRFEDVGVVGCTVSTASDLAQGLMNGGFNSLWTVAKNIAGVNPR